MAGHTRTVALSGLGRRFWTLWLSFATSNLGDGLGLVVFPLLAVQLTDDAVGVAMVNVLRFLPFLLFGLPAGVVLDRFGRRNAVLVAQLARSAALAAPVVALAVDRASIAVLAASAFVVGIGEVITDGGEPAIVRDVVAADRLEVANARLSATQTSTNYIIGPLLGAAVFTVSPTVGFMAVGALYLGSALALVALPAGERRADPESGRFTIEQLTGGLRFVWDHPLLRPLALAVALFATVGAGVDAVLVILATQELGLSEVGFGWLLTISAVTSVLVSFVVAGLIARTSHGTSMRISIVTYVIGSAMLGLAPGAGMAGAAMAIRGAASPTWNVVSATVRQRLVPDVIFGRMMTAYLFLAWSMQPVGAFTGGAIAQRWGADVVLLLAALAIAGLGVVGHPLFRRIDIEMANAPAEAPT
ncbi:MAG: MFS transporter [Actinomycetota bacterium]